MCCSLYVCMRTPAHLYAYQRRSFGVRGCSDNYQSQGRKEGGKGTCASPKKLPRMKIYCLNSIWNL